MNDNKSQNKKADAPAEKRMTTDELAAFWGGNKGMLARINELELYIQGLEQQRKQPETIEQMTLAGSHAGAMRFREQGQPAPVFGLDQEHGLNLEPRDALLAACKEAVAAIAGARGVCGDVAHLVFAQEQCEAAIAAATTDPATGHATRSMDEYDPLLAAYNDGNGDQTGENLVRPTAIESRSLNVAEKSDQVACGAHTYKARAEALAEALRRCTDALKDARTFILLDDKGKSIYDETGEVQASSRDALAAWNKEAGK
jgi:hypothetical protein